MSDRFTVEREPLQQVQISPVESWLTGEGNRLVEFGKAAFGTLLVHSRIATHHRAAGLSELTIHLGEQLTPERRVNRQPAGAIRYLCLKVPIDAVADVASGYTRMLIPPDERNTGPAAVRMPPEIGEVFPFGMPR